MFVPLMLIYLILAHIIKVVITFAQKIMFQLQIIHLVIIYNAKIYQNFFTHQYVMLMIHPMVVIINAPGFQEVCGKIKTSEDYETILEIESNKIGSQNTGTFVEEMAACKSGYAIEYCLDGTYECKDSRISKSLKCIDVKEINLLNGCTIKYNDGNEDMFIKLDKDLDDCLEIQVKLEMFEKYVDKMSKCDDVKPYDNEPLTCGNKDLRKYWYFYNNPKEYILYKDEDDVIDYLIQSAYSSSYFLTFAKLSILLMIFFI